MSRFRTLDLPKLIFESVRNDLSVTKLYYDSLGNLQGGKISIFYKFCLACVYVLKPSWDIFDTFRNKYQLVAQCNWTYAQLTNVLNYLYDNALSRITISESVNGIGYYPTIDVESIAYMPTIDVESTVYLYSIDLNTAILSNVTINVPVSLYSNTALLNLLIQTVSQIKLAGIGCNVSDGTNSTIIM